MPHKANVGVECKIVPLKEGKNERSPGFAALFSTRGGPFPLLLPPPSLFASTAPEEGLHGGLLEGSCGRRRRRGMPNRQNVGEPAYLFQHMKRSYLKAERKLPAASSSFSASQCFEKRIVCCGRTTTGDFPQYSHGVDVLLLL